MTKNQQKMNKTTIKLILRKTIKRETNKNQRKLNKTKNHPILIQTTKTSQSLPIQEWTPERQPSKPSSPQVIAKAKTRVMQNTTATPIPLCVVKAFTEPPMQNSQKCPRCQTTIEYDENTEDFQSLNTLQTIENHLQIHSQSTQ